jgi:hypothetical protein
MHTFLTTTLHECSELLMSMMLLLLLGMGDDDDDDDFPNGRGGDGGKFSFFLLYTLSLSRVLLR